MKYILQKERESLNIGVTSINKEEASLMKYILAYQTKSQMHMIREQVVKYALEHGNKKAAEEFECHRNTVSKWKNRGKKKESLKDRSRAPRNIPHKIDDQTIVDDICRKRDATGYSSFRLKMQYDLKPSNMAINRILHENDKIHEEKKKWKEKQDLWEIKKLFKSLETKLQLDGKNLLDIPRYHIFYKLFDLPKWEYTLRDVKSGATFLGYSSTEDGLNSCTFITYVFEHLKRYGVDLSKLTIQTDGATWAMNLKSLKKTALQELIEDVYKAKLVPIPQGGTSQSDVETFHSLVEREFYKRKSFSSKQDFYAQAYEFLYDFNYVRKNSHKDWKTPVFFLNQDRPETLVEVLDLPPIYLDNHPEIYWYKLDPKFVSYQELQILDMTPKELPCEDFHPDEILQDFVGRVIAGFNQCQNPAHDVPIHPIFCTNTMKFHLNFNDNYIGNNNGYKFYCKNNDSKPPHFNWSQ